MRTADHQGEMQQLMSAYLRRTGKQQRSFVRFSRNKILNKKPSIQQQIPSQTARSPPFKPPTLLPPCTTPNRNLFCNQSKQPRPPSRVAHPSLKQTQWSFKQTLPSFSQTQSSSTQLLSAIPTPPIEAPSEDIYALKQSSHAPQQSESEHSQHEIEEAQIKIQHQEKMQETTKMQNEQVEGKNIRQQEGVGTVATMEKKVKLDVSDSSSSTHSLSKMPDAFQERIAELLFEDDFDGAFDQIKQAEELVEGMEEEQPQRAMDFAVKLSRWCGKTGKERYGTVLLRRVLGRRQKEGEGDGRMKVLRELGRQYEQLKQYKSAIEVNLQLVRAGEWQYLDKVGQMHMLRENYSEALKYYQRYHQMRNDTYSLVKLAHAYSKIPSYSKRAVDLLNDLLFLNKTSCIFRPRAAADLDDFQSALLLLVTIYMNLNGHKKAADICEKYLKEDFGAYPIYYILGVLRMREDKREEAFACFLNAIRLKPNHLPSLLELLRFLSSRSTQVISVLRKAFLAHHRDWRLLQILLQAATKAPCKHPHLTVPALIDAARTLEGAGLQDEAEGVWQWAAELIDDRQRRVSVVDQEFAESVYMRLGEIALSHHNFTLSERYFFKVLQKLQVERGRRRSIQSQSHHVRLEIQVLRRMAFLKSEKQQPIEALSMLQQSRDIAAANHLPMQVLSDLQRIAQIHFAMERYSEAAVEFEECCRLIEEQPGGAEAQWERWKGLQMEVGNCYQNLREWRKARRVYQHILSRRLCEEAIRALANLYVWQGDQHRARQLLQGLRVVRPKPTFA